MSLTAQLAEAALALGPGDLPERARRAAKISLADGLVTMLAALALEPAVQPLQAHARGAGPGRATLLSGGTGPAPAAALANGALAHALDFEDVYEPAGLHPNASLIPAVLALAEEEGATGAEVLLALAVGCDAACRIGLALASDPAARGWYYPPMVGAAGAAFGCARLLRLNPEQTCDAVTLTLVQFALTDAIKASPGTGLRALREGLAARAAVDAVRLAQAGMRGVEAPLEGQGGLIPLLTGQLPRPGFLDGYGRVFHGTGVGIKAWPSCRGTHEYIVLAERLAAEGVTPDRIARIEGDTCPPNQMLVEPLDLRQRPPSAIAAKFSIPYTMAHTLVHGAPGLSAFGEAARADREVTALAARITGRIAHPGPAEAEVHVTLTDGSEQVFALPDASATLAPDLPPERLHAKAAQCLAVLPSAPAPDALLAAVDGLDAAPDLGDLVAALRFDKRAAPA